MIVHKSYQIFLAPSPTPSHSDNALELSLLSPFLLVVCQLWRVILNPLAVGSFCCVQVIPAGSTLTNSRQLKGYCLKVQILAVRSADDTIRKKKLLYCKQTTKITSDTGE